MSGGGGSQTTTQIQGPPEFVRPYWEANILGGQGLSTRPLQLYGGQGVAGFSPEQLAGQEMMAGRALRGNQLVPGAESEIGRTISGEYLNPESNPYLSANVNRALSDVTRQYQSSVAPNAMAQFQRGGAFGGSAHQEYMQNQERALGDTLGGIASQMYGQNYAQERQNQLGALNLADRYGNADYQDALALMQVGDIRQRQTQAGIDYDRQLYDQAWNYPYNQLNFMQGLISGSPYQQSTGPNPNYVSPGQGALGGAAAGASMGSSFGPWGTGIGAVAGGLMGYYGNR
jgi:hypothetical protein